MPRDLWLALATSLRVQEGGLVDDLDHIAGGGGLFPDLTLHFMYHYSWV